MKAKTKSASQERPKELPSAMVIRVSHLMRERLRVAAFKARMSPSAMARLLIETGLKQKRGAVIILACLAIAGAVRPAHAIDQTQIYQQIASDVTCAADQCMTLRRWREYQAEWCKRFVAPDPNVEYHATPYAVTQCSNAQFGLEMALTKANSYGHGLFTDHSEPEWFHGAR